MQSSMSSCAWCSERAPLMSGLHGTPEGMLLSMSILTGLYDAQLDRSNKVTICQICRPWRYLRREREKAESGQAHTLKTASALIECAVMQAAGLPDCLHCAHRAKSPLPCYSTHWQHASVRCRRTPVRSRQTRWSTQCRAARDENDSAAQHRSWSGQRGAEQEQVPAECCIEYLGYTETVMLYPTPC